MRLFRLHKFQILKGIYYFSVFFLASGFSYVAFADPPGSAYAPGATLDPSCAPGSTNCTVSTSATASGSDGYLQFNTSGSLASDSGLFWDNTNKRLGVGSSTPSAPLTVVGQVLAGYFTGTTTATSTFGGNLAINGTGTSTSNGGFDITAGCYAINGTCIGAGSSTLSAGGTGAIQFASGTSFAADATNLFWDDSTNRLGIGTSTPAYSLDVNGDANIAAGSSYKYNGVNIANASTTLDNYFFGASGNLTMTGNNNTAVGNRALITNTTGGSNIAIGSLAMLFNTTGAANIAIGRSSLGANTDGWGNTATGYLSLTTNTSGMYNVANGSSALRNNTLGNYNTAVGTNALNANTTGIENTAVGYLAGYSTLADHRSVTDTYTTFFGSNASRDATIASTTVLTNITAIGYNAKVGASNSMVLGGTGADAVKVGIGTTTPSFTLDVNGDANIAAGSAYKYNGANIAIASTTLSNYFFGGAGNLTMTGSNNTGNGYHSLFSNISGADNTALGYQALYTATSTSGLTAVGSGALTANTTGDNNTAVGWGALQANTTGSVNSAFGVGALITNTTGGWNAGFGFRALRVNSSGNFNTANGTLSLSANTTGGQNTASGYYALGANTTASANTAFGYLSGYGTLSDHRSVVDTYATFIGSNASRDASIASTTVLTNITAIGQNAKVGASNSMVLGGTGADAVKVGIGTTTPSFTLDVNGDANIAAGSAYKYNGINIATASTTLDNYFFGGAGNLTMTGMGNTATGYQALYSNISTDRNTAYGYRALRNATSSSMSNTAIGYDSLYANTSGSQNTAVGESSLSANTTGSYNASLGRLALGGNTTGGSNTAVGSSALGINSTGNSNSAFGRSALYGNTTGSENVAFGHLALYSNTTGRSNTAVGYLSGYGSLENHRSVIDTYATFLGWNASRDSSVASTTVLTNITAIGQNAKVGASNSMVLGGTGANAVNVGIGTTTPSSSLTITGRGGVNPLTVASSTGSSLFSILSTGALSVGSGANSNIFINGGSTTTTAAINNIALGYQALTYTSNASDNVALGYQSLYGSSTSLMTGYNNFSVGNQSGYSNTTGYDNTFIGYSSGRFNTTGSKNSFIGHNAGRYNTTGSDNFFVGTSAGDYNETGSDNTFFGFLAGSSNSTGSNNIFTGRYAGASNSTGYDNFAAGQRSLNNNISGYSNISIGTSTLYYTTGSNNLGLGARAGYNSTGSGNIFFGYQAASSTTAGGNNIAIGYDVQLASTTASNQLNIGSLLYGTGLGTSTMSTIGKIGIGTSTPGSLLTVAGGAFDLTAASTEGIESAEMITGVNDRTFAAANNWSGTNWSVSGGHGVHTAGNNAYTLSNTFLSAAPVAGNYYQINFDINTTATGTPGVSVSFGGTVGTPRYGIYSISADASQSIVVRAINSGDLIFTPNNTTWTGYIDSVSVKQITPSAFAQTIRNSDGTVGVEMRAGGTGLYNTFIGKDSGLYNTTGAGNAANGYQALMSNTTGGGNLANGYQALMSNTKGGSNVANGYQALMSNTTGNNNIAIGSSSLTTNTTGGSNVAIGADSGEFNLSGANNTFIGQQAGQYNTLGSGNTFIGTLSGWRNSSGNNNFAVGGASLLWNALGSSNIAIGVNSFSSINNTNSSNNIGLGENSGYNSTGSGNIFFGYQAASSTTAGGNNIAIGYDVQLASTTASNQLNIGSFIYGTGLGTSTMSTIGKIGIGTTTPIHTLNVEQTTAGVVARFTNSSGYCDIDPTNTALVCTSDATLKKSVTTVGGALNAITSLRGVNFKWLSEDDSTHTHLGVIAQEVEQILPELVATDVTTGKKSVNYIGFVPVLIEAVKELANRVTNLEARIAQGVSDGISNISDFVVNTLTAKKVVTETLEMKDSATGETYCVKIANGEWDKTKGACASAPASTQTASVIEAVTPPAEGAPSTPAQEEVASSTPEVIENVPDENQDVPASSEKTPTEEVVPAPEPAPAPETPTEPQL